MTDKKRIFISVGIPDEITERTARVADELPDDSVRKVSMKNMHLTLRFIGEINGEQVEKIKEKLGNVGFRPFEVSFRGVGAFPSKDYIRVIWAGIEKGEDGLKALAMKINRELEGFPGDERFSPHLTICRVRKKIDAVGFFKKHSEDDFDGFLVRGFSLMESRLVKGRPPEYTEIAAYYGKEENE